MIWNWVLVRGSGIALGNCFHLAGLIAEWRDERLLRCEGHL